MQSSLCPVTPHRTWVEQAILRTIQCPYYNGGIHQMIHPHPCLTAHLFDKLRKVNGYGMCYTRHMLLDGYRACATSSTVQFLELKANMISLFVPNSSRISVKLNEAKFFFIHPIFTPSRFAWVTIICRIDHRLRRQKYFPAEHWKFIVTLLHLTVVLLWLGSSVAFYYQPASKRSPLPGTTFAMCLNPVLGSYTQPEFSDSNKSSFWNLRAYRKTAK